uniref:hypothetical protein n=1 Tax=Hassallia byssoidea TaxID=482630 RepID=UPI000A63C516|nr:hypothetical protein [Hassalia byssoidea]
MELLITLLLTTQQPKTPPPKDDGTGAIITALLTLFSGYLSTQKKESTGEKADNATVNINQTLLSPNTKSTIPLLPELPEQAPNNQSISLNNLAKALPNNIDWTDNLIMQTALIWGNQGGGKSWLARYSIKLKLEAGYKVIVLDPDSNPFEWQGVESYHDWQDIKSQIESYLTELESRLIQFRSSSMSEDQWASNLFAEGKAIAYLIEEATTYSSFIKNEELLETFGKLGLTKSRKQLMPLTIVSHNNTQSCLFGIKGLGNLVSKMLQVECLAEVNKETLKPQSTGKARLKLDSSNEWLNVQLPELKTKITKFSNYGNHETEVVEENSTSEQEQAPLNQEVSEPEDIERGTTWTKLADKVYISCKGKGEIPVKRLPSNCNAVRDFIKETYGSQNLDDANQLRGLHIIVGVLVSLDKASFINAKYSKYGDVIHDKDNLFVVI